MRQGLFFLLIFFSACGQKEPAATSGSYFDLNGYFEKEKARLVNQNPLVDKTVSKGPTSERKKLKIKSWDSEFAPFITSDINKPSWKDSYQETSQAGKIKYTAREPKLRTRLVEINKDSRNQVQSILITNQTENTLYSSSERLEYYPDSLYRIRKKQTVVFIGTNDYTITGRIIK